MELDIALGRAHDLENSFPQNPGSWPRYAVETSRGSAERMILQLFCRIRNASGFCLGRSRSSCLMVHACRLMRLESGVSCLKSYSINIKRHKFFLLGL